MIIMPSQLRTLPRSTKRPHAEWPWRKVSAALAEARQATHRAAEQNLVALRIVRRLLLLVVAKRRIQMPVAWPAVLGPALVDRGVEALLALVVAQTLDVAARRRFVARSGDLLGRDVGAVTELVRLLCAIDVAGVEDAAGAALLHAAAAADAHDVLAHLPHLRLLAEWALV
jgi:hypothetical protein